MRSGGRFLRGSKAEPLKSPVFSLRGQHRRDFERQNLSVLFVLRGNRLKAEFHGVLRSRHRADGGKAEIGKADLKHDCVGARDTAPLSNHPCSSPEPPSLIPEGFGRHFPVGRRTMMRQPKHAKKSLRDVFRFAPRTAADISRSAVETRRYGLGAELIRDLFRITKAKHYWYSPNDFRSYGSGGMWV